MRVINQTRKLLLAERVLEARTFAARWLGWRLRAQETGGVYLSPCRCVHTLGLRFSLDAVYINREGRVLAVRTLVPGRIGPWFFQAAGVLELPAGTCARTRCLPGDQLVTDAPRSW